MTTSVRRRGALALGMLVVLLVARETVWVLDAMSAHRLQSAVANPSLGGHQVHVASHTPLMRLLWIPSTLVLLASSVQMLRYGQRLVGVVQLLTLVAFIELQCMSPPAWVLSPTPTALPDSSMRAYVLAAVADLVITLVAIAAHSRLASGTGSPASAASPAVSSQPAPDH